MNENETTAPPAGTGEAHGEIKVVDRKGYSQYLCADCGQNINNPVCTARTSTQPNPPTFDSLLADPTQQLDQDGVVAHSAFAAGTGEAHDHAPGIWCNECPDANEKRIERVLADHQRELWSEDRDCRCGWRNPMNGTGNAHRKHVAALLAGGGL